MTTLDLRRWLRRLACRAPSHTVAPARRGRVFVLERLEERAVPVVGFDAFAPEVQRGGHFDGVVLVEHGGYGTGALLKTGQHILTAAHVASGGGDGKITFQLNRGEQNIDIEIEFPSGATALHPDWITGGDADQGNDLAILTLIDQVNPQLNRHLIAPFGATRYDIYTGQVNGLNFLMVGFGRTGTGADGNHVDEVQRVQIRELVEEGTFTLTIDGKTTASIPQNASRSEVQAAFAGIAEVEVSDRGLPAGTWDIRFLGADGGRDMALLAGAATGGASVVVTETFPGGQSGSTGVKRWGENVFDLVDGQYLTYDFDDGTAAHSSLGNTGLNNRETAHERGDSGGPALVNSGSGYAIVGVNSYFTAGGDHDINNFDTPDGSFGTKGTYISVATHQQTFLNPILGGEHHLVLDMEQQVLGLDGLVENLTIRARRDGDDLVISVAGSKDPRFNGEYYRGPITSVLSLTLRGSGDNEVFLIDGDLGLGSVTIDGRGGHDSLKTNNRIVNTWTITGENAGTIDTNTTTFSNVERLIGGVIRDIFRFTGPGRVTGRIHGAAGNDWLDYRSVGGSVTVNLNRNVATLTGGLAGIEHALGSTLGNSVLVGSKGNNILVGYGTDNVIRGLAGRDLIFSTSATGNFHSGGAAQDVVVATMTGHSHNIDALQAFMNEWSRGTSYESRVKNLLTGGGRTGGLHLSLGTTDYSDPWSPPLGTTQVADGLTGTGQGSVPDQVGGNKTGPIQGNAGQDFFVVHVISLVADYDRRVERYI